MRVLAWQPVEVLRRWEAIILILILIVCLRIYVSVDLTACWSIEEMRSNNSNSNSNCVSTYLCGCWPDSLLKYGRSFVEYVSAGSNLPGDQLQQRGARPTEQTQVLSSNKGCHGYWMKGRMSRIMETLIIGSGRIFSNVGGREECPS